MIRATLVCLSAAVCLALPLAAQAPATPPEIFTRLVGTWDGEAWYQMGPGGRQEARQREWVEQVAGGTVIAVKGLGTMTMTDGSVRTVHDAFAVVHLDHDGVTPMLRAFTAQGHWMDMEITARVDGYTWTMSDPRVGQIRYEMTLDAQDRWVEKGFRQVGDGWVQFMEMTLHRVP